MPTTRRITQVNSHDYKEITLPFRRYRATHFDKLHPKTITDRLVCPMLDAARSKYAYGQQFLQGLKSSDLEKWAKALDMNPSLAKNVAYFSGKVASIPKNMVKGSFDDKAVNHGFIHSMKNEIHTKIFKDNKFDQDGLNAFVWAFHSELRGVAMTNDFLYSNKANELYFDNTHLDKVLEYNQSNRSLKKVGLGLKLSTFEMRDLLLNVLGQKISNHPTAKQAILIRDIHDLYKYGFVPAHIEEKLEAAQLLTLS